MTLARDGWREMLASTLTLGAGAVACAVGAGVSSIYWLLPAAVFAGFWLFTIAFFRVPSRTVPNGPNLLVAPADGRVTEVTRLDAHEGISGPALKISIFLSVFDVHVNCAPCDGKVVDVQYRPGEFLDARHPECGVRNESNTMTIQPDGLPGRVIVRQIAGLIARRIVCNARAGDRLARGELFGLIKFGSRTDVIVAADSGLEPAVHVGQHVKCRETILLSPQIAPPNREAVAAARANTLETTPA
jgi:phosphatidylserine decarboxylase